MECKTDPIGSQYIGTKNVTRKGFKCLPWMNEVALRQMRRFSETTGMYEDGEHLHFAASGFTGYIMSDELYPRHNFCRNPVYDENGPWCFKSEGIGRDFCDVPHCSSHVPHN